MDFYYPGESSSITVSSSGITAIEFVSVTVNITHGDSGDLEISLEAPSGTESVLAEEHGCYEVDASFELSETDCTYFNYPSSFTFGTVRHLDESADGTWTLTVRDLDSGTEGRLNSWSLKFYGREN